MRKGIYMLLLAPAFLQAQSHIDLEGRDFFEVRNELRAYYDSLIVIGDTSEIFAEGAEYAQFKRWEEYWSMRIPPGKTYSDFLEAEGVVHQSLNAKKSAPNSNSDPWHEIGPLDKPNSGANTIGQGSEPGIGPIHFITFCDSDPNGDIVVCGSAGGGLFYRDMANMSAWQNMGSDAWPRSGCKYAVFQPGSCDIVYAANPGDLGRIGGIHRYNPVSELWEQIADHNDLGFWNHINKLHTDEGNTDVLYAATKKGLYRSIDVNTSDPSWTKIVLPAPTNDPTYGSYTFSSSQYIEDIEMEPSNGQHIYLSVKFHGIDPVNNNHSVDYWKILHSTDGGASWGNLNNTPTYLWQVGTVDRNADVITLEVSPDAPTALYAIFAINDVQNPNPNQNWPTNLEDDDLYKLSDYNTGSWTLLNGNLYTTIYGGGHGFGVSPLNADEIYLSHGYYGRYSAYINGVSIDYHVLTGNNQEYHVDGEDFAINPITGYVWMANHGGINRSMNNGVNWNFIGQGLGVADCFGTATSYSEPGRIAIGLYHDGNVISDGNMHPGWQPSWRQLGGADGQHPMVDPKEGNYVYWHSQKNLLYYRSDDHGVTSTSISPGSTAWDTHNVMDPEQPNIFYVLVNDKVKRTMDRGNSFEVISDLPTLFNSSVGLFRLYISPSNPEYLYANLQLPLPDGPHQRIVRTNIARGNAAIVENSWENMALPLIPDPADPGQFIEKNTKLWLGDVVMDPEDPNVVYYGFSSALYYTTTDHGTEMLFRMDYNLQPGDPGYQTDLTGTGPTGLPNTGGGQVCLERGSNGGIYFGTDIGVFYTNNEFRSDGTGWVLLGPDLPHVQIRDLDINYVANKIRASLPGRGVWEHDLYCPSIIDKTESSAHTTDLYREVQNNILSTATVQPNVQVTYRAGNEVTLEPGFHAQAGAEFHAFIHGCDQPGNSFKSLGYTVENGAEQDREKTIKDDNGLHISPNPSATGQFRLQLTDRTDKIDRVEVFNLLGARQGHRVEHSSNGNCIIHITNSRGLFIVKVTSEKGAIFTQKVQVR